MGLSVDGTCSDGRVLPTVGGNLLALEQFSVLSGGIWSALPLRLEM